MSVATFKIIRAIMKKQYNEEPLKHQYLKKTYLFIKLWYTLIKNRLLRVLVIEKKY